jgi:metal-sulfur cluster biosynthetic enzyme
MKKFKTDVVDNFPVKMVIHNQCPKRINVEVTFQGSWTNIWITEKKKGKK